MGWLKGPFEYCVSIIQILLLTMGALNVLFPHLTPGTPLQIGPGMWALIAMMIALGWGMDLVLFGKKDRFAAKCLDGSPAGFYWEAGGLQSRWVIFLEGGGSCGEPVDCKLRARGPLGSSKDWPQKYNNQNGTSFVWGLAFPRKFM